MGENYNELKKSTASQTGLTDVVLGWVMLYIDDPEDRNAVSLVCRRWYELDALTRKHVTIALCYTTSPERLRRRFPHLESLKLKGKPRAAMFDMIPEDWGGYVTPWGEVLRCLKLDKCSGFSTDGLLHVGRLCRQLRTLFLEDSSIIEKDGRWIHEIAMSNSVLETLNFYMTDLVKVSFEDLQLIARNCRNLVSVKISDCEILDLVGFFHAAAVLEEFYGGSFYDQPDGYAAVTFPSRLCRLGLTYMGKNEMPIVFPFAPLLKELDLLYALLDTEDHCWLIQRCPNLEVLKTRNVIGDRGLVVVARRCKQLKRLRIEPGAEEEGMEDEGLVSQTGLMALAQGCLELEYLAVYVSDITNASLEYIGAYLKNMCDFRLVLLNQKERITDLPLDKGVRALLRGCGKLRRFALHLRPGGLTDAGLGYIGQYSWNIRWMLLGYVGESDAGLLEFSNGCPKLQKLEIGGCFFSEHALAAAMIRLTSLRYLWVLGYRELSQSSRDLLAMARLFWNIELVPARSVVKTDRVGEVVVVEHPGHLHAYYSLAGPRIDFPDLIFRLNYQRILV
ncbi:hypothetical protein CXB51_005900 [Gossypium anomalum]|uniref:Coronatine-insensitive protein 1 n=1 Tax=Gossypium anomalum TaxID=47600 RepID=A0A8J5ZED2_9ROSI|nr:hypothetical protein CXB51_005900 [Gossypium anomalum]